MWKKKTYVWACFADGIPKCRRAFYMLYSLQAGKLIKKCDTQGLTESKRSTNKRALWERKW